MYAKNVGCGDNGGDVAGVGRKLPREKFICHDKMFWCKSVVKIFEYLPSVQMLCNFNKIRNVSMGDKFDNS